MAGNFRVAVMVGSLRKESFSRKVAKALIAQAPPSLDCRFVEIGELPLYNEDLDGSPPDAWTAFRESIREADAVLFVTPEYNRSVPGVLKNALDIASRPSGESVVEGRPAGVVSVTPYSLGAFGANHAIRQTFVYLNMPVMQQPEAYVSNASDLFNDKGELTNAKSGEIFTKFMAAFAQWVERNRKTGEAQSFEAFLKTRSDVASAYVNGDAKPLDRIVAQSGAASFFPPGGGSETGAENVKQRYDQDVSAFASGGETHLEVLHAAASGDVAYWTGFQTAKVMIGGSKEPLSMKLRITELFRLVDGEWKMVHRHADPMAEPKQPGAEETPRGVGPRIVRAPDTRH